LSITFARASKAQIKVRMALAGVSGSGKTLTALKLATALSDGKPFAVIDTEHGRAQLYTEEPGVGAFDTLSLGAPFSPDRYIACLRAAEQAGYGAVVVDSGSHEWFGEGGILDIVDAAARNIKGNSYMAWKTGTPVHQKFLDSFLQSTAHCIVTFRSKQEYVEDTKANGTKGYRKEGTALVTRDGAEYEFDLVGEMDLQHNLVFSKTRCSALDGRTFNKPGADVVKILREWMASGAPAAPVAAPPPPPAPQHEPSPSVNVPADRQNEPPAVRASDAADYVSRIKACRTLAESKALMHALSAEYPTGHAQRGTVMVAWSEHNATLSRG
jgi:hypothetical protein